MSHISWGDDFATLEFRAIFLSINLWLNTKNPKQSVKKATKRRRRTLDMKDDKHFQNKIPNK